MFALPIFSQTPEIKAQTFTLTCPSCLENFERDFYVKPEDKSIHKCSYCDYRSTFERFMAPCEHQCDCLRKNHEAEKYVKEQDRILNRLLNTGDIPSCEYCGTYEVARIGTSYKCYECGSFGNAEDIGMDPTPKVITMPKPEIKREGIPFNIPPVSSLWTTFKGNP